MTSPLSSPLRGRFFAALFLTLLTSTAPAFAQAKKIVFLAGPKDHGAPGRHEHILDLTKIAESFEKSSNLKGVTTKLFVGKAPRDMKEFEDASVIVIESSSDRADNETHPLFPPNPSTNGRSHDPETTAYLKQLNDLIKAKKIGVVILHYANWAENWQARALYLEWTGGLWVQMVSKNPVDQAWAMTIEPEAKSHPILNGVKPWTYRDEIFQRFHLPTDKRRTNLLLATASEDKLGIGPQIASFAYQRDDGGRGFVYGGMDWHDNLKIDDYRRFLLNGIAWAANIEIPSGGIDSPVPDVSGMTPGRGFGPRAGGPGAAPAPTPAPTAPAPKAN